MNSSSPDIYRYCGRPFTRGEIELIRNLIASEPKPNRSQLSRIVCDKLGWFRPDGRSKEMSCRVAMLRMERDGLITLPLPLNRNGNGHNHPRITSASDPREAVSCPVHDLENPVFRLVLTSQDSSLWNELIERYHYLGYTPLPGAQLRYMVESGHHLLAVLGFGAAAWSLSPRDHFIGWNPEQRKQNLNLVVNNNRFLILPWVHSKNLASKILAELAKRLPQDWQARYGYQPFLLETFVQQNLFRGTCYRAANWVHVGHTQGRGKLDRYSQFSLPVKDIFLYPLHKDFQKKLCSLSE
jgi:hypothetical protein